MKNTAIKTIVTILLIVGIIETQFAYALSDMESEGHECFTEITESETSAFDGESLDSESESIISDVTNTENTSFVIESESAEDEIIGDGLIADETDEAANLGSETFRPSLRNLPSNYFTNVYDAAGYLDEQIVNYINYNGPSNITIYIHYGDSGDFEAYQAALFSHLYNAFCGYDDNFYYSIVNNQESNEANNIRYYKFTYYLNAVLTRDEAIQAWNEAQNIANGMDTTLSFTDKTSYINNEIRGTTEYHHVNHGMAPTDHCDTAYSLCTGKAICSGFTGAFCLICYQVGLNAVPLWGRIKKSGSTGGGHAWNLIQNGSTWKQMDCTNNLVLFGTNPNWTFGVYNHYSTDYKSSHMIDTTYSGWFNAGVGWTYIDSYGYSLTNQWKADNSGWCYLGKDGCIKTDEWLHYNGEVYYLKSDGHMAVSEWIHDPIGYIYINSSGYMVKSQWIQKDGYWYYLKANGYRAESEWIQDSVDWCYLGSDGIMVTSTWAQDSVGWCYLDSSGHLTRSQWLLKNGEWYYLKADGHMAVNEWAQDSVGWCYMDSNGHMIRSQWFQKNGEWYYFKSDGHMAANEWAQDSVGWCYMDSNGHITRSQWLHKNGYWYYLKANGYMAASEWAQDSIGYCWMDSNGHWDSGTKWIGSPRYIGSSYILSGHRVDSQTITIDGYNCTFNAIGRLTSFTRITEPTPEPV